MRLAGKTAFITGGNSGIGLATARLFVAEGAKVAITGRDQETLDAAAKELGPNAIAIRADAKDLGSIEASIATAVEAFGKLDVVFANAGIGGTTPLGGTTLEKFEDVLTTNVTGVFFTIQAAAPHLNDGASVILNGLTDPPCLTNPPQPMPTPGGGMGSPGCEGTHVTPIESASWGD